MSELSRESLLPFLKKSIAGCQSPDGWINLSEFGAALKRELPGFTSQAYGELKLAPLIASYSSDFEARSDNEHYPPVVYIRSKAKLGENRTPVRSVIPSVVKSAPARGIAFQSPDLLRWAYMGDIATSVRKLKELALDERWSFGDETDPDYPYPILWNYLRYTFFRLMREKKILESRDVAAFSTGLVDKRYEPIHAFFRCNPNPDRQKWRWSSFCIAGEGRDGKDLVRSFNPLPEPAHYFSQIEDMIYDVTCGKPEVDWEHVIIENIDRLPLVFLHDHTPNGFAFEDPAAMTVEQRANFFSSLGEAVRNDSRTYRATKNRLVDALDLAIKRTRWNFKTAIPQYYPRQDMMTLLLPLALVSEDRVDLALVVEKTRSGSYLGHTIFPLHWAYMNARQVCRPDSDWLVPSSITALPFGQTEQESSEDLPRDGSESRIEAV